MTGNAELIEDGRIAADTVAEPADAKTIYGLCDALEAADATIALRDDRISALESERDFLYQEIAYCTERLRKAGVKDGITTEPKS